MEITKGHPSPGLQLPCDTKQSPLKISSQQNLPHSHRGKVGNDLNRCRDCKAGRTLAAESPCGWEGLNSWLWPWDANENEQRRWVKASGIWGDVQTAVPIKKDPFFWHFTKHISIWSIIISISSQPSYIFKSHKSQVCFCLYLPLCITGNSLLSPKATAHIWVRSFSECGGDSGVARKLSGLNFLPFSLTWKCYILQADQWTPAQMFLASQTHFSHPDHLIPSHMLLVLTFPDKISLSMFVPSLDDWTPRKVKVRNPTGGWKYFFTLLFNFDLHLSRTRSNP